MSLYRKCFRFLFFSLLTILTNIAIAQVPNANEPFTEINCYSDNDMWSDELRVFAGPAGTLKAEGTKSDGGFGPAPCKRVFTGAILCTGDGGSWDGATGEKLQIVTISIQPISTMFELPNILGGKLTVKAREREFVARHIASVTKISRKKTFATLSWMLICD